MSQDLRLYSLSLMIVLMLWVVPLHAEYSYGNGCAVLAVPIDHRYRYNEDPLEVDTRELFPDSGTDIHTVSGTDWSDCVLQAGSGTYYDGANHLWVLDDDLTCNFNRVSDNNNDFRSGDYSY